MRLTIPTDKVVTVGVIVTELVTNAFKHAYPADRAAGDGRVALRHTLERSVVRLTVEDDGVGWSGKGTVKGTGLGTRIVRAMASSLGSTLTYERTESGTFTVLDMEASEHPDRPPE